MADKKNLIDVRLDEVEARCRNLEKHMEMRFDLLEREIFKSLECLEKINEEITKPWWKFWSKK